MRFLRRYDCRVAPPDGREGRSASRPGDPPLARSGHADFREKLFLYREANVLLALMDRVSPSSDGRDPLFEPVLGEYECIIFRELSDHLGALSDHPILHDARRQSVTAALEDLKLRMHPSMGNRYDFARDWSRNWFAGIGHNEINPARLEHFSWFWSDEYNAVQKALEVMVETSSRA